MDTDGNGTIDRLEWLAYLCSPVEAGSNQLGSKDYYDFELREYFERVDLDKDGLVTRNDLAAMIKLELATLWNEIDSNGILALNPLVTSLASDVVRQIKGQNYEIMSARINWVELKGYRQMLLEKKSALKEALTVRINEQRRAAEGL